MTPPRTDQLRDYLAPDEPLVAVSTGTVTEAPSREPGAIGITDRRILCVSRDGRFVSIGFDAIRSIRSRPRTTRSLRGNDYRLVAGGGCLIALLGFGGVVASATSLVVPLLGLVTVGALVAGEYLRRTGPGVERDVAAAAANALPSGLDAGDVRRRYERHVPDDVDEHRALVLGSLVLAVLGAVGLTLSGVLPLLGAVVVTGGIALVDYALRHREEFDGIDVVRRRETELSISTDHDRAVHIRSDPSEEVVQKLTRAAYADVAKADRVVSPRS